jgi:gamma-glutamylcyclotransferase (GGCT)/AIG2-like uncharacterized protein YtfP
MGQPARLFVYGTLMPGHEAWSIIEPYAAASVATTVRGRLYDTGAGYPAAIFEGDSLIAGTAVVLDGARADDALTALDRYEGPEYRRIVVDDDHGPLYAYEWIAPRDRLVELPSGAWTGSA